MFKIEQATLKFLINGAPKMILLSNEELSYSSDHLELNIIVDESLSGERITATLHTTDNIQLEHFEITLQLDFSNAGAFFSNGFQSWSESKLYKATEKIKPANRLAKKKHILSGDNFLFKPSKRAGIIHSWNYTYFTMPEKKVQFIGSVDEKNAFTNFVYHTDSHQLKIIRDVKGWNIQGEATIGDFFWTMNSERGAFQHYFMLCEFPEPKVGLSAAYSSGSNSFTNISETEALNCLHSFKTKGIPLTYFLIDGGYASKLGDWLETNPKYPSGMQSLSQKIKSSGYKSGLGIAPFSVEKDSKIFKEHTDWLLKDENGWPIKSGVNNETDIYTLNFYHPEAQAYISKVLQTICQNWEYDLIKLDFLYSVCISPQNGKTRAKVMFEVLSFLKEIIGEEKIILADRVPIGSAMGMVDYCKVSSNLSLKWEHKLLKWYNLRERPSTALSLTNVINRRQLSQYPFFQSPDISFLDNKKQKLNAKQRYTVLLTHLIFGDLFSTAENIGLYDEETLHLYQSIFPLVKSKEVTVDHSNGLYRIRFQVDNQRFLAYINLSDKDKLHRLSAGIYFNGHTQEILSNQQTISITKHESVLLNICSSGPFGVLGSEGHIFPGTEIKKIALREDDINIQLREGLLLDPVIFLKVPLDYTGKTINGQPFEMIKKKGFAVIKTTLNKNQKQE